MRTFIINLDKNVERLSKISRQLGVLGVPFERICAVYGKALSETVKRSSSNLFAWWCVKGYAMRDGELGAALSHQLVYRTMIDQQVSIACVFEDDANPNEFLPEQLRRIRAMVNPDKPEVFLLADHTAANQQEWGIWRLQRGAFAEGYVLTLSAARALLKDNFPVKTPADSWSYWVRKGIIDLYQTTPASCDQAWEQVGYQSDVTPDCAGVTDVRRMSHFSLLLWKVKRVVGVCLGRILFG